MLVTANVSLLLYLCALLPVALSAENRTIDDSFGDSATGFKPEFTPSSSWNTGECAGCAIKPDAARAFGGTWTEATHRGGPENPLTIRMRFRGTAIYVYFILADFEQSGEATIDTRTDCTFHLDSTTPEPYLFASERTGSRDLLYNQLAFSRTGLADEDHVLEIVAAGVERSYINFDYAIYTSEEESAQSSGRASSTGGSLSGTSIPPSSSETNLGTNGSSDNSSSGPVNMGAIVGGVLGSVAALAIAILAAYFLWRRRRSRSERQSESQAQGNGGPADTPAPGAQILPFSYQHTPVSTGTPQQLGYQPVTFTKLRTPQTPHEGPESNMACYGGPSAPPAGQKAMYVRNDSSTDVMSYTTTTNDTVFTTPYGGIAPSTAATSSDIEEIKTARQAELGQRLQAVQRELDELARMNQSEAATPQMTMGGLAEHMRLMQRQIEILRENQRSDWAAGLTDQPPPDYNVVNPVAARRVSTLRDRVGR